MTLFLSCCSNQSAQASYKVQAVKVVSLIVAIASVIILALGCAHALPISGNLPAQIAGGVGISLIALGWSGACVFRLISRPNNDLSIVHVEDKQEQEKIALENKRNEKFKELNTAIDSSTKANFEEVLNRVICFKDQSLFEKMVSRLVDQGQDLAHQDDYSKVLKVIAQNGTASMLEYLKHWGIQLADPAEDEGMLEGMYAIHLAIASRNSSVLSYLIKEDRTCLLKECPNGSFLHFAVDHASRDCLEMLIREGVNLETKNDSGLTAFEHLLKHKRLVNCEYFEMAKVFIFVGRREDYHSRVSSRLPRGYNLEPFKVN